MKKWRCTVCGYIHQGDEPPETCPVCGAGKEDFELLEDETTGQDNASDQVTSSAPVAEDTGGQWKCLVCGFIHQGENAPAACPVCKATSDRFESQAATNKVPDKNPSTAESNESPLGGNVTMQSLGRTIKPLNQLVAKSELLTRLHGHPIAVHIPNGVLPVSLVFTLLAILFKSEPLAVAAKYNCIFVAISMPVVLITGFIDWFNRFNGRLTSIFKIKIVCGLIVSALTLVLALWWTTNPTVFLDGGSTLYLFVLIYLLDFATAAVAGFYGGKLVFKK